MKTWTHPAYAKGIKVKCMCGNEHVISSTMAVWNTPEICSKCHPAYNAGVKIEKAARGRLQAYQERMAKVSSIQKAA